MLWYALDHCATTAVPIQNLMLGKSNIMLFSFQLMESCVKNCGQLVHDEVCTKTFMEELRELVKHASSDEVKQKVLEILQTWGMAFRNQSKYRIVTVRFLFSMHFFFPSLKRTSFVNHKSAYF